MTSQVGPAKTLALSINQPSNSCGL